MYTKLLIILLQLKSTEYNLNAHTENDWITMANLYTGDYAEAERNETL